MVVIVDNSTLGLEIGLGDREGDIIQSFIDLFIEKNGLEYYNKATLLIVRYELYYFIIKNTFGEVKGGLVAQELPSLIQQTLTYE